MPGMNNHQSRSRVPEGVPSGGQFAAERRSEPDTTTLAGHTEDPLEQRHDPDAVIDFDTPDHPNFDFVQLEHREAIWDEDAETIGEDEMRATGIVRVNLHDLDLGEEYRGMSAEEKSEWLDEHHIDIESYFDQHHGTRNLDKTDFSTDPRDFGEWDDRALEYTTVVPRGASGADIVAALEDRTQASRGQDIDEARLRAHLAGEPYPAEPETPQRQAHQALMRPWESTIADRYPAAVGTLIGRDPDSGAPRIAGVYKDGGDLIVSRTEIAADPQLEAHCLDLEAQASWESMEANCELGGEGLVVWEETDGRVDPESPVVVSVLDRR
jgi:hypothetical protein